MRTIHQRRYDAFRANKRAWISLWIFVCLVVVCVFAECIANDKPLFVRYEGKNYFPLWMVYLDEEFGGDFQTEANYLDPLIINNIKAKGFFIPAPIPYAYDTIITTLPSPAPTPPSLKNWLGTDELGRDVLSRLIYGLRNSILFACLLTFCSVSIGIVIGGVSGYYGGKIDLFGQRVIEVWNGMPILFILIILASLFEPTFWTILFAVLLFSWMGLVPFVRAEFLKVRNLDYIKAARALGASDGRIIFSHILPNALIGAVTYIPFILCGSISTLASLDFLGLGLPPPSASLGELLAQGKNNLHAPWLGLSGFFVLSLLLSLLVFIGEGLRDSLGQENG